MKKKKVTIYDVASEAGVSFKTVSRVLNGESARASTRERVLAAVNKLGYKPDIAARRLAGKKSYTIVFIYGDVISSYIVDLQLGLLDSCGIGNYELIMHPCPGNSRSIADNIRQLIAQCSIDGVVLTPPLCDNLGLIRQLERNGLQYVLVSPKDHDKGLQVYFDERSAAYDMTAYLIGFGHRRIGFIQGDPAHSSSYARYTGYKEALKEAAIAFDRNLVVKGKFGFDSGCKGAKKLLRRSGPPTAIFASDDDTAVGVIHYAHEVGLRMPEQLSVVGFDDVPIARYIWPTLTTVRQPIRAIGEKAGQLLIESLGKQGESAHSKATILEYEIIERGSCAQLSD